MSHRNQGSHWLRPSTRLAIYTRDDLACVYCGRTVHLGGAKDGLCATIDHVVPRAAGGSNSVEGNLVCACRACNAAKGESLALALIGAAILRAATA